MHRTKCIFLNILIIFTLSESYQIKPNAWTPPLEIIKIEGYPCEEHSFQTSDGYVLKNYRIPGNNNGFNPDLYPVGLFHGMSTSAKDFMLMGNRSLAFQLANEGYDVWLPNMRFTEFSSHVNYSRDDSEFWNFGIEENAAIDIAEAIEDILRITGAKKIIFIGLSLANPLYFILCNLRPDMTDRIAVEIMLGPAFYESNFRTEIQTAQTLRIWDILSLMGINHFTVSEEDRDLALEMCTDPSLVRSCYDTIFGMIGEDWENVDWVHSHLFFGRTATYVVKQYMHLFQIVATGEFKRFDYGPIRNMEVYGSQMAPMFNMKACKAPLMIYHGRNDKLVNSHDLKKLLRALKGSKNKIYVKTSRLKAFNHADFVIGKDATDALYKDIILFLKTI